MISSSIKNSWTTTINPLFQEILKQLLPPAIKYHLIYERKYLNPLYADTALIQCLYGIWEKQRDSEAHSTVQGHCHKHTAGWDGVSQKDIERKGDKDNYLAGTKEGGHVEASQVGAFHDFGDLLAKITGRGERGVSKVICPLSTSATLPYFSNNVSFQL